MKTVIQGFTSAVVAILFQYSSAAQNDFTNLNFESAQLPILQPGQFTVAPIGSALPGWIGMLGSIQQSTVFYNAETFGGAAISVIGPNYAQLGPIIPPIEGNHNVVLMAGGSSSASISQIGTIPNNALSLQFRGSLSGVGSENIFVSLGGTPILMQQIGGTSTDALFGGDISSFAGLLSELRITAAPTQSHPSYNFWLDSIAFSPTPVPEPSTFGLIALAVFCGGCILRSRKTFRGSGCNF